MALSATINASLSASNAVSLVPSTVQITTAGNDYVGQSQEIGTAAEALNKGDIGTAGYLLIVNDDTTNYVDLSYSADGSSPFAVLPAGGVALLKPTSATLYAKANTAACNVRYVWLEA